MNTKICTKCGIEKELIEFNTRKDSKDGYRNECKLCKNRVINTIDNSHYINHYKTCSSCKIEKNISEFYKAKGRKFGVKSNCKNCNYLYEKEYMMNNPDKNKNKSKQYRNKDTQKYNTYHREYYKSYKQKNKDNVEIYENSEKRKLQKKIAKKTLLTKNPEYFNDYNKAKRLIDPEYKISQNLRNRINSAVRGFGKIKRTEELLGISFNSFKSYIESKFLPTMTWDNYGSLWEIDHIIPCKSFKLIYPAHQIMCFNYRNLQPLFKYTTTIEGITYIGNINKGSKLLDSITIDS